MLKYVEKLDAIEKRNLPAHLLKNARNLLSLCWTQQVKLTKF